MPAMFSARHGRLARACARVGGRLPLLAALLLVGCVSPPATPALLYLSHVKALLGDNTLPDRVLYALGVVNTPATNGQPAVLVGGGTSSDGLLVPLSGGKTRSFAHGGSACQAALSVGLQGQMVACVGPSLSVFAPDGSGAVGTAQHAGGDDTFAGVSWEPGGAYVDVLEQVSAVQYTADPYTVPGPYCFLDRYTVGAADPSGASGPTVTLKAQLELPEEIRWCGSLAWDPNGTYLALRGYTSYSFTPPPYPTPEPTHIPSPTYVFLVSGPSVLAQLSAAPTRATGTVPTLSGLTATSVSFPYVAVPQTMAWEPNGDWLTVAVGTRVVELNVASGQTRELFRVPDAAVCALAWTPDGTGLAFIHCNTSTTLEQGNRLAPARLYLYTPPAP